MLDIKLKRISLDELTNEKTKEILKKLGYSNYYEHIIYKRKIGIKPPVMTPELEDKYVIFFYKYKHLMQNFVLKIE